VRGLAEASKRASALKRLCREIAARSIEERKARRSRFGFTEGGRRALFMLRRARNNR